MDFPLTQQSKSQSNAYAKTYSSVNHYSSNNASSYTTVNNKRLNQAVRIDKREVER